VCVFEQFRDGSGFLACVCERGPGSGCGFLVGECRGGCVGLWGGLGRHCCGGCCGWYSLPVGIQSVAVGRSSSVCIGI
jgi:hypothetical protein